MAVGRPASGDSALVHDDPPLSIGQPQPLVAEFFNSPAGFGQFFWVKTLDGKAGELANKVENLDSSVPVVPPQEPAVAFGDDQRRGDQTGRAGKQSPK